MTWSYILNIDRGPDIFILSQATKDAANASNINILVPPTELSSHRPRKAIVQRNQFPAQFEVVIFSSIGIMILIALSGLVRRAAMGGGEEYAFINLGRSRVAARVGSKFFPTR